VRVVECVEVFAQAVVIGVVVYAELPVADGVGDAGDLQHAGREFAEMELSGSDGVAVEGEVVEEDERACVRAVTDDLAGDGEGEAVGILAGETRDGSVFRRDGGSGGLRFGIRAGGKHQQTENGEATSHAHTPLLSRKKACARRSHRPPF